MRRHWAILVVAVLVLVVLPIGAAYRALHSESALQWALAQLSRVPNIRFEAAGASGTLAGPLTIERLVIDHEAARIEARGVRLDARMRSLLAGNVHLEQATVERLDVVLKEREEQSPDQRHAVLFDRTSGEGHTPPAHLSETQAPFHVHDSLLSEFAVLGFEYGYSVEAPDALVLWEQFGDFVNGAQVIIDQFSASAREKWGQTSRLVLLLPHGHEGQGPEHSSARLERFLQLCAQGNLQVACPSTPAQYFHLLRRQARAAERTPLIVFTPKSFLRHPGAVSRAEDLVAGRFAEVLEGSQGAPPGAARHVEGYRHAEWVLMDYVDIVVHIFSKSARAYYDLERLWRDGKRLDAQKVLNARMRKTPASARR